MFKEIVISSIFGLAIGQACFATPTINQDKLNLAGTYQCQGNDSRDGKYKDAIIELILDSKNSDFAHNYGAYGYKFTGSDGSQYTGSVAANKSSLAIYFKNTDHSNPGDQGVEIGTIDYKNGTQEKTVVGYHDFYYDPHYKGGGNGFETCIKQNDTGQ